MRTLYNQAIFSLCLLLSGLAACQTERSKQETENLQEQSKSNRIMESPAVQSENTQLRHVVLFKFKPGADTAAITKVEEAFAALPSKIPQIKSLEWGLNNSPEGLDKGFTHCFFLTFDSEEDRAIYLPHPDHKAFGVLLTDILEDVTVVDYWTN